ncbi:MAG: nucleotide exchange factor GrpE [Pseudomonadota bacterium]
MGDSDYEANVGQEASDPNAPKRRAEDDVEAIARAATGALQDEVERLNDQLLRTAAELENTRRRAEREKVEAGKYAIASFARDLLSVSDNFERALASTPESVSELTDEGLEGLVTGVRMTEKELLTVLERHGVSKLDPTGERFDPNLHQAVAQAPAPGVPAGHVAQTAQTGFVLGDRVLRAAMVIVSTGDGSSSSDDEGPSVDTRV